MIKAIIVDLDGTLCNVDHRIHLARAKKWAEFHGQLISDSINEWCLDLISKFAQDHHIILMTGRPEDHRLESERWLVEKNVRYDVLYMRESNDFREDCEVKSELYKTHIEGKLDVSFVVEDRKSVVDMWRQVHKLTVLQCAEGLF